MIKESVFYRKQDTIDINTWERLPLEIKINRFDRDKTTPNRYTTSMDKLIKRYFSEKARDINEVTVNNDILQGSPTIKGTRLPISLILAYIRDEEHFDALLEDFPYITEEQIKESLNYLIKVIGDPYQNE